MTKKYPRWLHKKPLSVYNLWVHIMKVKKSGDAIVCKEWMEYDNFYEWYHENFYIFSGTGAILNKDLIVIGNKLYSPETCVFLPRDIGFQLMKKRTRTGTSSTGVWFNKKTNQYVVSAGFHGYQEIIGRFGLEQNALDFYKKEKETYIHRFADINKKILPNKVYNLLLNYETEVTE